MNNTTVKPKIKPQPLTKPIKPLHVFKVLDMGQPVRLKPELGYTLPSHADMLRYDCAFHDPADPSRVVFPEFVGYKAAITMDRWRSFGLKVLPTEEYVSADKFLAWTGYRHDINHELMPETLLENITRTGKKVKK